MGRGESEIHPGAMSRKHHGFFIRGGEQSSVEGEVGQEGTSGTVSWVLSCSIEAERDEKVALQDAGGNHTEINGVGMW